MIENKVKGREMRNESEGGGVEEGKGMTVGGRGNRWWRSVGNNGEWEKGINWRCVEERSEEVGREVREVDDGGRERVSGGGSGSGGEVRRRCAEEVEGRVWEGEREGQRNKEGEERDKEVGYACWGGEAKVVQKWEGRG